ncbi:MAG: response regulator, partial [Cyanobacteria bacterium P01_F01_bin.53]
LDLMLPDIDGFGVLQKARQQEIMTPIIVLTALSDLDIEQNCYELGANAFLPKPFTFSELNTWINKLLD